MPYNFAADSFHKKKLCSRLWAVLRFWAPLGDLGATYDDHLRLIGKRIVDFRLVLTELFSPGVTAISLQLWLADPKFQVEGVTPTKNYFSRQTR